jgi:hypothetical protein
MALQRNPQDQLLYIICDPQISTGARSDAERNILRVTTRENYMAIVSGRADATDPIFSGKGKPETTIFARHDVEARLRWIFTNGHPAEKLATRKHEYNS